ncbi:MAG: cupin domain-containing protein [Deltaproteobacteria bacterium]|jgi:mannose-6-phosphate isomerase-like protein (cupin superfamily)|nr:cupin domain-containing protein [Deltaproteobacteria bacterium]
MIVRSLAEVKPYDPPVHFGAVSLRLQGAQESGLTKFWVGMTHFLPGGGAEWDYENSPTEKVYFVMDGEMTIKTKDGEVTVKKYDSLYLAPNEGRSMVNKSNLPCVLLVSISMPPAAK